jgi:RNA polymerase-associated protein LEO1
MSSEEDNIRRPRRGIDASHFHNRLASEDSDASDASDASHRNAKSPADSDMGQINGDDDADLFGSGSERESER